MERHGAALLSTLALAALACCGQELIDHGRDVVQGTIHIPASASAASPTSAFLPFTPPAAGEVTVSIDWDPSGNRVSFAVSVGPCSTSPCLSEVDMGPFADGARNKPVSGTSVLSAQLHTLRVDNWGGAAVTATYRVRLIPR